MCSGQRRDRKAGEPRTSRLTLGLPPIHIGRTKARYKQSHCWLRKGSLCLGILIHSALGPGTCLAYEALNQCLLKTIAVAEPSTHIRRRPWKGSGTSCYHRAASVEPCGGGWGDTQKATHCSAVLQKNHLHTADQSHCQGGERWRDNKNRPP